MDSPAFPVDLLSTVCFVLLMLFNSNGALLELAQGILPEDSDVDVDMDSMQCDSVSMNGETLFHAALNHFRLWSTFVFLEDDLGFWVKPRSTTWFSTFLLHEYDDRRWIEMFRFSKRSVFNLASLLAPTIRKRDTKYRLAVPVLVRVACTLFKLSHGASFLICSEMFAVGRSTVSIMLREVVHAINVALRNEIRWPWGEAVQQIEADFHRLCGLPGVCGAIDGTQIAISKPRCGSADYYYFKSGGYTINCQAVVDSSKHFLDLYVGMPGSTNDSRMLRRSSLFRRGQQRSLWDNSLLFHGFAPYLLADSGYPLLPWLMVPHRRDGVLSVADSLFNRRLSRGRAVVENAFGILKMTFRELHDKCELDVAIVPDVVTCCALLHNVLQNQSNEDVDLLLDILRCEERPAQQAPTEGCFAAAVDIQINDTDAEGGQLKRSDLGAFLSVQRIRHAQE